MEKFGLRTKPAWHLTGSHPVNMHRIYLKGLTLRIMRRTVAGLPFALSLLVLLAVTGESARSQTDRAAVPANATEKTYGTGWDCDRSYRLVDGGCEAIQVPANAVAIKTSFGRGWECRHGYQEVRESCIAVEVPENAYLDASGLRWDCRRGFREADGTCVAIVVPRNGFLTESKHGSGWKCERGYRAVGGDCIAVEIPQNAHLDYSGNDWECDRPYQNRDGKCILP